MYIFCMYYYTNVSPLNKNKCRKKETIIYFQSRSVKKQYLLNIFLVL